MRTIFIPAALIAALATSLPIEPAQAAGCIKGAIAGGLAGHVVGHGVLGAAGGCFAGRGIANRSARQKQLEQQNLQNGNQGYTSGACRLQAATTQALRRARVMLRARKAKAMALGRPNEARTMARVCRRTRFRAHLNLCVPPEEAGARVAGAASKAPSPRCCQWMVAITRARPRSWRQASVR